VHATDSLGALCSVQVDRAVRSNDDEHNKWTVRANATPLDLECVHPSVANGRRRAKFVLCRLR
jgi:hypothetical protein